MIDIATKLTAIIDSAKPKLLAIMEARANEKPYPDKWSQKELLGHLIDSASNNHQRIVRMQLSPNIGKFSYEQDRWVTTQQFDSEPWAMLVEFWYLFNVHIAHVIAHVDTASLSNVVDLGHQNPSTLKFMIEDYVRHVEHHLGQILGGADPRERGKWVSRQ